VKPLIQFSYSRVDCYCNCKYLYKLRYIDKLKTYDDFDPLSALTLGTALHKGIETDVNTAIQEYYNSYPVISDKHIEEAIKLEYLIPKVKAILDEHYPGGEHEVKIETPSFIGYIDYLYPVGDGTYGIIDFKYSNNVDKYLQSKQLHVYKFYVEQILKISISKLSFLFIPKIIPRQKKNENLAQFRKRIIDTLNSKEILVKDVPYEESKVQSYLETTNQITNSKEYPKNPTGLCQWCEFKEFCINGNSLNIKEDKIMNLPSTNRVAIAQSNFVKLWIYGAPFSGKTTLADKSDTPLNLNTDGNVKYVSMPRLAIKDEVTTTGRITKRKYAWEVFTEAIDELEKGSDFKTVVVDLLEDTFDYCRVYMCDKNNWEHESDDSFKAYDIVRSEFLRNIKRLLNLPYNIILISHEDTSRDIMAKDKKITAITPNLQEKLRNKIAGMVDLVCRVVVESDGTRKLQFKSNEVVFGGGRLQGVKSTECPLSWDALMGVYKEALDSKKPNTPHMNKVEEFKKAHTDRVINMSDNSTYVENVGTCIINDPDDEPEVEDTPVEVTKPVRRERRERTTEPVEVTVEAEPVETVEEETTPKAPVRRVRRNRGDE
jgi:phage nucleotide-binding protein